MEQLILVAHVLASLALVVLVLLQQGKGAEMGASFGSGASQTLFGSQGSIGFLGRATAVIATIFFLTSFSLAIVASRKAAEVDEFRFQVPGSAEIVEEAVPEEIDEVPVLPEVPVIEDELPVPAEAPESGGQSGQEEPLIPEIE